jgi:flagellar hook assembly protein FlgD
VKLEIYNLRGQLVRGLADALLPAGSHHFVWNGIDNNNRAVGSGIYFIKVQSGGRSTIERP